MGWRDLLSSEGGDRKVFPWLGGLSLRSWARSWTVDRMVPPEFGWWEFIIDGGRMAKFAGEGEAQRDELKLVARGYLVGDLFVADDEAVFPDPQTIHKAARKVFLIEPGLDRFVRVAVGLFAENGPLIFKGQEFPLGPEDAVLEAFLDEKPNVDDIKGVSPGLQAAFMMETWQRAEANRRRAEADRRRREEEARLAEAERRKELVRQLGDGAGRRAMAQVDFGQAARAALAVGGAVYLDHRQAAQRHEMVVRFRFENRRFECTCDARTLQIIDAGICLTAHDDRDGFDEGTKGDRFFTLESLPGVIKEAIDARRLVIFRHVT